MSTSKPTTRTGRSQQTKKATLEVEDIADYGEDGGLTAVLYGKSGSGKTTLGATWPTPILYLDVSDRGTRSIRDVKGIKVRKIGEFEDFEETYWYLKENPEEYATVIIDTVSQLQSMVVSEHSARKGSKKRAGDWGSMSKGDWGDVAALLKEWIINYRDLEDFGINVVFIAQDRAFNVGSDDDDENEGLLAPEVGPALSPSVAKTLNAAVTVIGNTFIRERVVSEIVKRGGVNKKVRKRVVEYCLRVGPDPTYITKVRKPKSVSADEVITNPSYDDIMDIIEGK